MRKNALLLTIIVTLVGIGFVLVQHVAERQASADDSYRTTGLSLNTYDFDDDGTAENAISASLSTTQTTDTQVRIDTFWREPNQNENSGGSTWADREDSSTLWVQWKQPRDEYDSGTVIRVVFTCSNGGGQTFSYERTVSIP